MTLSRSVKWIIAVVIALLVYWGIDVPTDLADPKTPLFLAITVGTVVVWAFELMPAGQLVWACCSCMPCSSFRQK